MGVGLSEKQNAHDPKMHHRTSIRLKEYDYSREGMYFVTICTRKRVCVFGNIVEGRMHLNEIGSLVDSSWLQIPGHFPNAALDVYQIMPNHVHGIIRILDIRGRDLINQIPTRNDQIQTMDNQFHVEEKEDAPTKSADWPLMKNPKPTLGKMIRSFKARATKMIHDIGYPAFAWQGSFNDHVIRDGKDLDRIRRYILDNPTNWAKYENFPGNIRMDRVHIAGIDWSVLE